MDLHSQHATRYTWIGSICLGVGLGMGCSAASAETLWLAKGQRSLNIAPALTGPATTAGQRERAAQALLTEFQFQTDELELLRAGVGFDFNLSNVGNMHLNLYSPDNDLNKGKRWNIGHSAPGNSLPVSKAWSIGGKLEIASTGFNGERALLVVPQLMINLDESASQKAQITFQYSRWNGEGSTDEPVPQIGFNWSF